MFLEIRLTLNLAQQRLLLPPPEEAVARCMETATLPEQPDSRTAFSHCFLGGGGGAESQDGWYWCHWGG